MESKETNAWGEVMLKAFLRLESPDSSRMGISSIWLL